MTIVNTATASVRDLLLLEKNGENRLDAETNEEVSEIVPERRGLLQAIESGRGRMFRHMI